MVPDFYFNYYIRSQCNSLSSVFYLIGLDKHITNNTSNTSINFEINEKGCYSCISEEKRVLYAIFYFLFNDGLPFVMMMIFSSLLIRTILKSRVKILRSTSQRNRNSLRKDIQFAISSISLNFFFLFTHLPFSIYVLIGYDSLTDLYWNYLGSLVFLDLCDHFYILFFFNSVFRRELLILFRFKSRHHSNIQSR